MTPDQLEALGRLSAGGLLVGALAAFIFRWVYTRGEVRDIVATWRERYAEVSSDRDEWKGIAKSALAKVDRLTDVVETITGKKVPD